MASSVITTINTTISLNFTSQYTNGCHRIAYRVQGSGDPYTFLTVYCTPYTPPNPATNCLAEINVTLNNEVCDDIVYEGYIQPCCRTIEDPDGRIPWTVTFTPTNSCTSYDVTCDSVGVYSVDVVTPGDGYAPGTTPALLFTPAGDAVGYAKVEDNGLNTFTLTDPGTGGIDGSYVSTQAIPLVSGATVHAYFEYVVTGGAISSINITPLIYETNATGVGYTVGDTITLPGTWGTPPTITVDSVYNNGEILVCVITDPGTLYTAPPSVAVDAVGTTPPVLNAVLDTCPQETVGYDCETGALASMIGIPLGETFKICRGPGAFDPGPQFTVAANGCCGDQPCVITNYETNASFAGTIYFTQCTDKKTVTTKGAVGPSETGTLDCILQGSVIIVPSSEAANITITEGASC